MNRLLHIEWLKYRNYKILWIILVLYLLVLIAISSGGILLLKFLENQGADFRGFSPTIIPIYDFPDVWQNITYFATFFKIILAFIVIIIVTNEIGNKTLRQNIIDGMSRSDYILGKILFIGSLCVINVVVIMLTAIVLGLIYSSVKDFGSIIQSSEFLIAYFLDILIFSTLAFLMALIFKKAGVSIILLALYVLFIEPFAVLILQNAPFIPDHFRWIADYLPAESLNNLIRNPFPKYILREIKHYIMWQDIGVAFAYLALYVSLIFGIMYKRDL